MTGLSLPLLATTTGGRTPDRYCSPCLDRWQHLSPEWLRAGMHESCRVLLEQIRETPTAGVAA